MPSEPSAASPTPAPAAPPASRAKWLTLLAACFGLAMLYIDLFIVNVALPAIARDLRASLGTVSWTIAAYALMIAVLPMGLGRLGDIWGQRRLYLAGLVIFLGASLACAFCAIATVATLCIRTQRTPVADASTPKRASGIPALAISADD